MCRYSTCPKSKAAYIVPDTLNPAATTCDPFSKAAHEIRSLDAAIQNSGRGGHRNWNRVLLQEQSRGSLFKGVTVDDI